MAYDAATMFADADFGQAATATRTSGFRPLERVAIVFGAAAVGAGLGVALTLGLGRLDTWMVAACAAPLFVAALYLTFEGLRETLSTKEWAAAGLILLLLVGLTAWPLAVFFAPPSNLTYWVGPVATLSLLATFIVASAGVPMRVYRAGALAMIIAVMAANQGLLTALGA